MFTLIETPSSVDYSDELQKFIYKTLKNKSIAGFKFDMDMMSGAFFYTKDGFDYSIYITPLWEGEETISTDIYSIEGEDPDLSGSIGSTPFKPTGDLGIDSTTYISIVEDVLTSIQKFVV